MMVEEKKKCRDVMENFRSVVTGGGVEKELEAYIVN